ncbi:MAG: B12-binding domain-containing radical SAM protein [Nitrospira sp. HN-bin3]|nr:MAG: B12-binding domain-containing radical SAM protein [Nitrospira sp. HN-bin3]
MSLRNDVLFITPPSRVEVYQDLSRNLAAIEPPVWAGLMAACIQAHGYDVGILDAEAKGFTHRQTAQAIAQADPRVAVFVIYGQQPSASTQCMPAGRRVCEELQALSDIPTLVMGTHPSALPGRTLLEEPYTYVCQGEGPYTVLGLLRVLRDRVGTLKDVPGLWYREQGVIRSNPPAPLIADLDRELPGQGWDLLDMSRYRAHNWHCFDHLESRSPYASLQTSLGCPFKCSFCCINAPFDTPMLRTWSPDHVIRLIDRLVLDYGVTNIKIPDEMFVLNRRHVLGICDRIIERGYHLNIWAYARVDTVQDQVLEKLKAAGFHWLGLGIESGSQHVRDGVEKGRFGDREIVATVERIRSHGIYVAANYIFGLPDDTPASMRATLDLALELNTEWANFYCAMAYPGSPLYGLAKDKGWPLPDDLGGPGWIGYSQHAYDTLPLPTERLAAIDVLDFRDRAFLEYFQHPSYLGLLHRTFGRHVADHVREMCAHHVRRRHRDAAAMPAV